MTLFDISSYLVWNTPWSHRSGVFVARCLTCYPPPCLRLRALSAFRNLPVCLGGRAGSGSWLSHSVKHFHVFDLYSDSASVWVYACVWHCSARYCMACQLGVCVSCCEYHIYIQLSVAWRLKIKQQTYRFSVIEVLSCFSKRISVYLCVLLFVCWGSRVCSPVLAGFRLNNVSLVGSRARRLSRGRKRREREKERETFPCGDANPPVTQCPPSVAELIESETPPLIDSPLFQTQFTH